MSSHYTIESMPPKPLPTEVGRCLMKANRSVIALTEHRELMLWLRFGNDRPRSARTKISGRQL